MPEIWKDSLNRNKLFKRLKELEKESELETDVRALIADLEKIVKYAYDKSKRIPINMPEYTLHDEIHIFNVMKIMDKLIPKETREALSAPELMLLLACAALHDIGMAVSQKQVVCWKGIYEKENPTSRELKDKKRFDDFIDGYPEKKQEWEDLKRSNDPEASFIEQFLISEFIRENHPHQMQVEFKAFFKDWIIKYKNMELNRFINSLCRSHGENLNALDKFSSLEVCGDEVVCLQYIGVILRLSDILDFDYTRAPDAIYKSIAFNSSVSIKEWIKHRSITSLSIGEKNIYFSATCSHPKIEKSIRDFLNVIDDELTSCNTYIENMNDPKFEDRMKVYKHGFTDKVDGNRIGPELDSNNEPKYIYKDISFSLSKVQIIDLLMGTKLYNDKSVPLRELVQNSIDACLLQMSICKHFKQDYTPRIKIEYYKDESNYILVVEDNGIGMDLDIINNYYSNIGKSYYKSKEFLRVKALTHSQMCPISRFGIGVLSCFMVSDSIEVETLKHNDDGSYGKGLSISIDGKDSIFEIRNCDKVNSGTVTKLKLRPQDNFWEETSKEDFEKMVKKAFPNPPIRIDVEARDLKEINDDVIVDDSTNETSSSITINENDFDFTRINDLQDSSWSEQEVVQLHKISLDNSEFSLKGVALIALLEKDALPVKEYTFEPVTKTIDGEDYTLEYKISTGTYWYKASYNNITIDNQGGLKSDTGFDFIFRSDNYLSIHGIEVPHKLFGYSNNQRSKVKLEWPFSMIIALDIGNKMDLDLNSQRTEIIKTDKWDKFEQVLATIVCTQLKEQVTQGYWNEMKTLFSNSRSSIFNSALKSID